MKYHCNGNKVKIVNFSKYYNQKKLGHTSRHILLSVNLLLLDEEWNFISCLCSVVLYAMYAVPSFLFRLFP